MSFGFRDEGRPSLRDRFRGKSSDQILEELRKELDKDKMFFDRVPCPPRFRRAGFPFDDDGVSSRGRPDFRHRLQELAQQHPEFADSLRPWYEQQQQRAGSNSAQPEQQQPPQQHQQQQEAASQQQPQQQQQQEPARGIAHHGLRNTVDLGEAQAQAQAASQMESDERNKRAQSAPPTGPGPDQAGQQRFVSRLDIQPQPAPSAAPGGAQDAAAAKPPPAPKASGNVRQIPIFVEGRDEPVMAKDDVDSSAANFGQGFIPHHPHHPFGAHQSFSRPHVDSARFGDAPRSTSPRAPPRAAASAQGFPSFREQYDQEAPAHKRPFQQQQHQPPTARQPPRQATPPKQPPQQQQQPPRQASPPREQTKPKDALEKVREVRDEVESLAKQVEEFAGSRQDKQYLFLDEMLTRELIKLDVIETEGRDDVRSARKEAIRAIQQCISKLESQAASGAEQQPAEAEPMEVEAASSQSGDCKTDSEGAAPAVPAPEPHPSPAEPQPAPSQVPEGSSSSPAPQGPQVMDTTAAPEAAAAAATTAAAAATAPAAAAPAPSAPTDNTPVAAS